MFQNPIKGFLNTSDTFSMTDLFEHQPQPIEEFTSEGAAWAVVWVIGISFVSILGALCLLVF